MLLRSDSLQERILRARDRKRYLLEDHQWKLLRSSNEPNGLILVRNDVPVRKPGAFFDKWKKRITI